MKQVLALKASAGSGKTTRLVSRYLELLASGANPNEILCLTFTNKAANEMKERIIAALQDPKNSLLKFDITITQEDAVKLQELSSLILDAPILTFDAFFNRILRSFCFYAGVPINYKIVPTSIDANDFLKELNEVSKWRVAKFLKEYDTSLDALLSSFNELYELPNLFAKKALTLNESTILSFANTIKKDVLACENASNSAKKAVDFRNVKELLNAGKTWLVKDELSEYTYFKKVQFSKDAQNAFINLKQELRNWFEARESLFLGMIAKWFDAYLNARKKRFNLSGECLYSDVTKEVWKLLRIDGAIQNDFLYFRLDGRITHVLIDEFQDTNRLQYDILEPIIEEITSGEGRRDGRTFFYVGDPKQSIYRFRGGVSALFNELSNDIESIEVEELSKGYRLFEINTNFVNSIFSPLFKDFANQQIGDERRQKGGYVEVCEDENIVALACKKVKFLLDNGVKESQIAILCFKNSECEQIADELNLQGILALREASSKLVNQKSVKAIIEWLKFSYFDTKLNYYNALKLFGIPFDSEIAKDIISPIDSVLTVVYGVMKKFECYTKESFALLELVTKYENFDEFINKIEQDDAVFTSQESKGVKVLTVHKSKGLEFDFVVVADRIGSSASFSSPTFIEYEGSKPSRIWRRDSMRENFDSDYAIARERQKQDAQNDERNALYVAFTRGKKGLVVVKKTSGSVFDMLNLSVFTQGEILVSSENVQDEAHLGYIAKDWQNFGRQEVNVDIQNDIDAINIGIATHRALEFWSEHGDEIRFLLTLKVNSLEIIEKAMQKAAVIFDKTAFYTQNKTVYKELGFVVDGKIGRIDMLAIGEKDAIIIDYKSGQTDERNYESQLKFYKNAVKKLLNLETNAIIIKE